MQHLWLIFARKLPLSTRVHLFMGIMAYLGSSLWFLFLLVGTWIAWDRVSSNLSQLPFESHVHRWLGLNGFQQSMALVIFILLLLFLPKILALVRALLVPSVRHSFGGGLRLLIGVFVETWVSILIAPCIMAAHALMTLGILGGRSVGWGNQNRENDGTTWPDALRFHAFPTILGVAWTALALYIDPVFTAWMSPILAGLVLAAPVSVWTSRARYGKKLARYGILSTPEELNPSPIIQKAGRANAAIDSALNANHPSRRGVIAAVVDPYVNGVHVSLLESSEWSFAEEALAERCLDQGPSALSNEELTDLLYLAPAMLMMHRAVWLRPVEGIQPVWTQAVESYRRRLDQ